MSSFGALSARGAGSATSALRGYAICTAPRSGSNWLAQLLAGTGVLGRPLEYFNGYSRRLLEDPTYPDDRQEQVRRILTAGATANGVYALKLFAYQFRQIENELSLSRALPGLGFVFLRRRDVLGQAISWALALQTNQYRSTQPRQGEPAYDRAAIAKALRDIVEEYALWQAYFARNGLAPVELAYEDALRHPQAAVDRIAAPFGLAGKAAIRPASVDLAMQRGPLNEEWRRRFVADEGDLDRL